MNEPIAEREPWACAICGEGDNATRYRNTWEVSLTGETPSEVGPEIGEEDVVTFAIEACDRCSKSPYMRATVLAEALREEIRYMREDEKTKRPKS